MNQNKKFNKSICFYFQVHQPYRLSKCSVFEQGHKEDYFVGPEAYTNQAVFEKVAQKCYLPTNALMLQLLQQYPEFKISYSFSGVFLEQCLEYGQIGQQVLDSFKALVDTGQVEVLTETYYHSLAWLFSKKEFAEQILKHQKLIYRIFGLTPRIFRNTELIYHNEIAEFVREMGFEGILAEGWDHYLGWKSPHYLYSPKVVELQEADRKIAQAYRFQKPSPSMTLLLKSYQLSDDIAFRFSNKEWSQWPLTAEKYATWVEAAEGDTINLFMDYETFGEHQWEETGIFEFMSHLPSALLKRGIGFKTPHETLQAYPVRGEVDVPYLMSWADMERDLSAWKSNEMQESALKRVFELEPHLEALRQQLPLDEGNHLLHLWRKLQTSDHFYYMCTKYWADGDVHAYFSCYESPYEAYIVFMNTLNDFEAKLNHFTKNYELQMTISP